MATTRPTVRCSFLAKLLAAFVVLAGGPTSPAADPIEEVGKTAAAWVKTRAETVRLEKQWEQDRVLLAATLEGLKDRVGRLQEKRGQLLAETADERKERAALEAKLAEAKDSLRLTEDRLQTLSGRVLRLRPRLPPRLADALALAYRSLESPEPSPGERMQLLITVLNRCAQFNQTISHGEEVLSLPGESAPKAVEVIYWGLSHGYALDRAAGKVWLGGPASEAWRWELLDGAAPAVGELLAISRDEADPSLVSVPARLKSAP